MAGEDPFGRKADPSIEVDISFENELSRWEQDDNIDSLTAELFGDQTPTDSVLTSAPNEVKNEPNDYASLRSSIDSPQTPPSNIKDNSLPSEPPIESSMAPLPDDPLPSSLPKLTPSHGEKKKRAVPPPLKRPVRPASPPNMVSPSAGYVPPLISIKTEENLALNQLPIMLDLLPLDTPPPEGDNTWLSVFQIFKSEGQKLARQGNWRQLAAMTGYALMYASYAKRMTRAGMLLDLARIYRDRLNDSPRAEQAFSALIKEDPANAEALDFLVEVYQKKGEWESIYDLYISTVEATWDRHERLSCTRLAADLAISQLNDISLAIQAWEHLWQLGDALDEVSTEITRLYRMAGRWTEMAVFLEKQVSQLEGVAQRVVLRELAEVKLSGLRDPDGASKVLEQIVQQSPQDPISTLQLARVYAQRKDWNALERLGEQAALQKMSPAALDLQRLVADALWQAGRLEQAFAAYNRILTVEPTVHDALARKQEFLTKMGRFDELLSFLIAQADSSDDDEKRAELLTQAAQLAEEKLENFEQAAKLWERRITIDAEYLPAFEALSRLYEGLADLRGIARALEGQLALVKEATRRIDLLKLLGHHYANRMGDDNRAEGCWKEILSLDPSNILAREELIQLHRRRGDFESLNSALMRQIWLTQDAQRAEKLCRLAAENLDENFTAPERSVDAWRRVLDFTPLDLQALGALARHYSALGYKRELIATLEHQIRAVSAQTAKIDLTLQVAQLWIETQDLKAAAANYERVLRWDPNNPVALKNVVQLYTNARQSGQAAGILEHIAALKHDPKERIELLAQILPLYPENDHLRCFFHLRRMLFLSAGERSIFEHLMLEAESAQAWPEMAAILTQLAAQQSTSNARITLLKDLGLIYEKKMNNPTRALLALQSILLAPEHQLELLPETSRLARSTGRFEDLLVWYDRLTTPEFDLVQRKDAVRQRALICEKEIGDMERAFHEYRRLLELDASDWEPLDDLERLAQSNHLWLQFDAVLTELGDRAASTKDRLKLLSRRERITRERLNDQSSAFNLLIQCYRLDVEDKQYIDLLGKDAQDLNTWHWLLPIIEANPLYMLGGDATQVLTTIAELYENKVQDLNHAFDLYCSVFMDCPESSDLAEKLQTLASQTNCFHLLTDAFRLAAALAQDPQQTVALLRRIAAIYETKLNAPERAIDIHRRLLALKEDEMPSLEVVIDWHRSHSEWRDLRDRLQQWVRLTSDPSRHVPYLLEIAQLSERYLLDPERALQTYGQVLEIEPENSIAQQGVKGLVVSITESNLRLRWLQMELKAAPPQRAIELRLEIAQIQEDDMGDISGAIATLQELIQETGPNGPGFKPLGQLLRKTQKWSQLIKLLQAQVEALVDQKEKLAVLQEAIDLCHEHLEGKDLPLSEDLYRSLLKLNPLDHDIRLRLARLLRNSGRFEDLCQHLEESLTDLDQSDDRIAILYELGGITSQNLGLIDQAKNHWLKILEMAPKEEGALLALARTALNQGDIKSYINYRRQQAQLLSPQEAAFVLCHLAEVCDEHEDFANSMIPFYREARSLDPNNIPAMEALKGIGRRLKNLRPAAALLPLEGERELNHRERAKRMKALGDNLIAKDLKQALDWYYRAVAVDPDAPAIWDALANALKELPDLQSSYRAQMGGLQALERSEPIVPDQLMLRADRFYQLALGAKSANLTGAYSRHIQQAYELVPHHPLSALAMAQLMIEENNISGAHSLLHTILAQHQDDLTEEQRVTALYCRGIVLRRLNQPERAMDDLREVLRLKPLYSDALIALGELQAESGRFAAALEHQIRALMLLENPKARAQVHYHIGVLWEDGLKTKDEAGACYELALTAGLTDRDLLHRSLRHFQRSGRLDQSLEVVNGLLPTAHDPEELATLWLVRGEIFAARPNQEEQAIEAFDMALSYNPARQEAREGLIQVLERLEDWHQLLQVLEAGCDVGTPELQSSALQRMADICRLKLNDPLKAEQYLRRSVDISPTRQALEHLEKIYTVESGRLNDRRDILGLLMSFGPPWFDRCMDLGRILLVDEKRWAWCILSPFLGVSQVNPDIKAVVQAMRKEYERPPVLWPAADDYSLLKHPLLSSALTEVLAELGTMLHPLGITSLESLGDGGAVAIGESTNLGKIFSALAHTMGMGGCSLYRTQELPESICIVNTPSQPIIVIRTDVIQQLVHAEVGFLFAYALTLAQPGLRTMAVLTKDNRDPFLPGLWLALGFTSSAGKLATKLADRIREVASKEIRAGWAERLVELRDKDPVEQGRIWWKNACYTARRAGLVAGADLRQAFRVLSRLEPELPRPRVVAKPEELDEYVSNSEILQDLVAFAASPAFGKILKNATTIVEA